MSSPLRRFGPAALRRGRRRTPSAEPTPAEARARARAALVWSELLAELPDEDLGEHPRDALELHRCGDRPRPEEAEYLEVVRDAADRMAGGR
ncbi:hypothetical protein F0L17_16030 [Streptomyces sp. TRM43335]|uniref:Uncharacterized protein n=1 Tax=Streptomyces taklimakanensis TaxID=2569853 RepID=A0A6G2BEA5_9ACTN|nr:hypothetical protein [Streptomyces taklimakanensis]MTE20588.1 hypothetical protein [Streptomyces taklimakanensis]